MIRLVVFIEPYVCGRQLRQPDHQVLVGTRVISVPALATPLAAIALVQDAGEREVVMGRLGDGKLRWHTIPAAATPAPLGQRRGTTNQHEQDEKRGQLRLHISHPPPMVGRLDNSAEQPCAHHSQSPVPTHNRPAARRACRDGGSIMATSLYLIPHKVRALHRRVSHRHWPCDKAR